MGSRPVGSPETRSTGRPNLRATIRRHGLGYVLSMVSSFEPSICFCEQHEAGTDSRSCDVRGSERVSESVIGLSSRGGEGIVGVTGS